MLCLMRLLLRLFIRMCVHTCAITSVLGFLRAHEHVALYTEDGAYSWVFRLCASTLMSGLALRENVVLFFVETRNDTLHVNRLRRL